MTWLSVVKVWNAEPGVTLAPAVQSRSVLRKLVAMSVPSVSGRFCMSASNEMAVYAG
jgi:hypothetical protein